MGQCCRYSNWAWSNGCHRGFRFQFFHSRKIHQRKSLSINVIAIIIVIVSVGMIFYTDLAPNLIKLLWWCSDYHTLILYLPCESAGFSEKNLSSRWIHHWKCVSMIFHMKIVFPWYFLHSHTFSLFFTEESLYLAKPQKQLATS